MCVCVCVSKLHVAVSFTHTHRQNGKCTTDGKTITYFFSTQPLWFGFFCVFKLFVSKGFRTAITPLQEQLTSRISIISRELMFFFFREELKSSGVKKCDACTESCFASERSDSLVSWRVVAVATRPTHCVTSPQHASGAGQVDRRGDDCRGNSSRSQLFPNPRPASLQHKHQAA